MSKIIHVGVYRLVIPSEQAGLQLEEPHWRPSCVELAGSAAAGAVALAGTRVSRAEDTPGVTATELKIGCTTSLSGPVSALGTIAKCSDAYFRMLNDQGGIAGIDRLTDTLVGRHVEVVRSDRRPRALRLMLGDHSKVELD